jgi:hypothetical protein
MSGPIDKCCATGGFSGCWLAAEVLATPEAWLGPIVPFRRAAVKYCRPRRGIGEAGGAQRDATSAYRPRWSPSAAAYKGCC